MAGVKGRVPAPKASTGSTRAEQRILLPSNRVAVFRIPNVGEWLDMRAEAIRCVAIRDEPKSDAAIGIEIGKLTLRRHLVGLTPEPVTSVLKPGTDLAALRAKAERESDELVAAGKPPLDIEAAMAVAEDAAEDIEATKASARPHPVTDIVWDEQDGPVGEYLAKLPTAMLDTPEGADWQALHDFAGMSMPAVMRGLSGPKAPGQPRIRSLR